MKSDEYINKFSRIKVGCITKESRFNSKQGKEIFIFSIMSRPDLGLAQPPIQWVWGGSFLRE
jgi:hypothetical protein